MLIACLGQTILRKRIMISCYHCFNRSRSPRAYRTLHRYRSFNGIRIHYVIFWGFFRDSRGRHLVTSLLMKACCSDAILPSILNLNTQPSYSSSYLIAPGFFAQTISLFYWNLDLLLIHFYSVCLLYSSPLCINIPNAHSFIIYDTQEKRAF